MSNNSKHDSSRRDFIKKLAYVPPAVMTLTAVPAHATTGSCRDEKVTNRFGGSSYQGDNNFDGGSKYKGNFSFSGGSSYRGRR